MQGGQAQAIGTLDANLRFFPFFANRDRFVRNAYQPFLSGLQICIHDLDLMPRLELIEVLPGVVRPPGPLAPASKPAPGLQTSAFP